MTMDQEFIEYVVKSIVSKPDDVQIERSIDERGVLLELTVNPDDLGRVIGKRGNTAQSMRTLLRALGTKDSARYNLKIIDNGDPDYDKKKDSSDNNKDNTDNNNDNGDNSGDNDSTNEASSEASTNGSDQWAHMSSDNDENDDNTTTDDDDSQEDESSTSSTSSTSQSVEQTKKELADLDDLQL